MIDFVTGLSISINWKEDSYDFILVIVDWLTKIIHYKSVKITINASRFAEVIIDMVMRHHGLLDSIMINKGTLFILNLWLSLCYFLDIKHWLPTAIYPQTDSQTKRQNSTIEAYLKAFVNFKQNDYANLLPMAELAYNNAKNARSGHMPFELNCGYHPRLFYEEDIDICFKFKSADKLLAELRELMTVYHKNLHHAQELQKQAHNKDVKPNSYASSDKVWLNSK